MPGKKATQPKAPTIKTDDVSEQPSEGKPAEGRPSDGKPGVEKDLAKPSQVVDEKPAGKPGTAPKEDDKTQPSKVQETKPKEPPKKKPSVRAHPSFFGAFHQKLPSLSSTLSFFFYHKQKGVYQALFLFFF